MTLQELKKLCLISGFRVTENQAERLLEDFGEITEIMDKIKDWNVTSNNTLSPCDLEGLREDNTQKSVMVTSRDIKVPRVVQEDD